MTNLARWIGFLLLVGSSSSCASASLYDWAAEKAPRTEVFGFVDRGGDGDTLLVRMDGEKGFHDGVYELPVAVVSDGAAPAAPRAPTRLDHTHEKVALELLDESKHVARLDTSFVDCQAGWLLIDGFDSIDGSLHRIKIPDRRYYLSDGGQVELADAKSSRFTKVEVHARRSFRGAYEERGATYLPPARRLRLRVAAGVAAAPVVVAVDIVTLPIQLLAGLVLSGVLGVDIWHGISFEI